MVPLTEICFPVSTSQQIAPHTQTTCTTRGTSEFISGRESRLILCLIHSLWLSLFLILSLLCSAHTHTHTRTYRYTHTHTRTYMYTHNHTHTHTLTPVHTCTHTHVHTCTTHTHTVPSFHVHGMFLLSLWCSPGGLPGVGSLLTS